MVQAVQNLIAQAGPHWLYALIASALAMICESAKPKPEDGAEEKPRNGLLSLVVGVLALITPFLLIAHGVWSSVQANDTMGFVVSFMVVLGIVIVSAIAGWGIAALAPAAGRAMQALSPVLSIAAFAFTVYVTWDSAWAVIQTYVLARLH